MQLASSASFRLSSFLIALALAGAAACSDSSGSDSAALERNYDIQFIDDELPPAFAHSAGFSSTWLLSGELDFHTRGRVTDTRWFETRIGANPPSAPFSTTETVSYRLEGERIIVFREYGAQVYSDTGVVQGDTVIEMRVKTLYNSGPVPPPSGPGTPVRYYVNIAP